MEDPNIINDENDNTTCGIIMPIANSAPYQDGHWNDVYNVLCEAATSAGLKPNLVSFDEDITVLHKRIIRNIYFNPIIICDISNKNPNVMFELGMRLAFDKPTIIVKDDKTSNSFDISSIEYLEYPSDLRYQSILLFKEKLKNKITDTLRRAGDDPSYSTFLQNFGAFKTARIEEKEVSINELMMDELKDIKRSLRNYSNSVKNMSYSEAGNNINNPSYTYSIKPTQENIRKILEVLSGSPYRILRIIPKGLDSLIITFDYPINNSDAMQLNSYLLSIFNEHPHNEDESPQL
jgi:hypothetical protein